MMIIFYLSVFVVSLPGSLLEKQIIDRAFVDVRVTISGKRLVTKMV